MLLRLWAYFDNNDAWFELLHVGQSDGPKWLRELMEDMLGFDAAVRVLCDCGLVEAFQRDTAGECPGYDMHRCVHSWVVHVVNGQPAVESTRLAMRCVRRYVPETTQRSYWVVQQRLSKYVDRSVKAMVKGLSIEGDEWILYSWGNLYADQGRLAEAETMYQRALQGHEASLRLDCMKEYILALNTMEKLANFHELGHKNKARVFYRRPYHGLVLILGPQHARCNRISQKLKI